MNIINKLNNYISDNNYKLIYYKDYMNIINYDEIKEFSNTKIVIKYSNNINTINGKNLVISKMLDNEILVTGTINNVEFR